MKKTILTYGVISGGIIILTTTGTIAFFGTNQHFYNEWLGYLVMILALSLVFFGVKSYRDNILGGIIKFKTAIGVGLGISLIASFVYTAGWEVYYQNSERSFMEDYAAYTLDKMKDDGVSSEEIEEMETEMAEWKELYKNPLIRIGITFTEIFPVGLIISLISAGILRRSEILSRPG